MSPNWCNEIMDIKTIIKQPRYLFLIIALPFLLVYAVFLVPSGGGFDEVQHICRAYDICHGSIYAMQLDGDPNASKEEVLYGGYIDSGLYEVASKNMQSFQGKEIGDCTFPMWKNDLVVSDLELSGEKVNATFSNTAIYSPIAYLPYALGYWAGAAFTNNAYALIIVMRLFGVAFFCIVSFLSLRLMPFGKWILLFVVTLPGALAAVSTVTADTMSMASCILVIAIFFKLIGLNDEMPKGQIGLLSVALIMLASSKATYFPLILLIGSLPLWNRRFRNGSNLFILLMTISAGILLFIGWNTSVGDINTGAMWKPDISPSGQMGFMVAHPSSFAKTLVMTLLQVDIMPFNWLGAATLISHWYFDGWIYVLLLAMVVAYGDRPSRVPFALAKRPVCFAALSVGVYFIIAILIITALYLQYNSPGAESIGGIQPRYFFPIMPLLLVPIVLMRDKMASKDAGIGKKSREGLQRPLVVMFVGSMLMSLGWIIASLH